MVPLVLQQAVYQTVRLRGPSVDESWAPWWEAQAHATVAVLRKILKAGIDVRRIDRLEKKERAFVERLKGMRSE